MKHQLTDSLVFRHGAQIRNRIAMAPMQTHSGATDGFVTQDTLDYYQSRSEAAGLLITEFHYVSKNGGPCHIPGYPEQLAIYSDAHVEGAKNLATALKKDGNKAILQIHHGGRKANGQNARGNDVVAPSSMNRGYPVRALTHSEIEAIIQDFGSATRRAIEAGYDGVEIHGANHYLNQQFFSTFTNRRDDQWGGSLKKRMAFPLAVVQEVKRVIAEFAPKNFVIGYRISPEEIHDDISGYTYKESLQLVEEIVKHEVDYIHLSLPHGYASRPHGVNQTYAELFDDVLDAETKLIIVGGVFSEAEAADAVENYADIIAVGRGTLVDPLFAKKIEAGDGVSIYNGISKETLDYAHLTPGLREAFTTHDAFGLPLLPGGTSILDQHVGTFDKK